MSNLNNGLSAVSTGVISGISSGSTISVDPSSYGYVWPPQILSTSTDSNSVFIQNYCRFKISEGSKLWQNADGSYEVIPEEEYKRRAPPAMDYVKDL